MKDRPAPGYTPARGEAKFPDLTLRKQHPASDQVAHDRIGHAVPDEDDGELAEEFGDEPSRPALGQVCTPEIGRSEDEVRSALVGHDASVQVHEA